MRIISTAVILTLSLTSAIALGASRSTETVRSVTKPTPAQTASARTSAISPSPIPLSSLPLVVAGSGCTLSLAMPPSCTPYSANSPFNLTVAQQAATMSPNSAAWMSYYNSTSSWFSALQFGYKNQVNQWQHPIYISQGSPDYSYNVSCVEPWFVCPTSYLHVPSYAKPAGGGDGHMGMIDLSEGSPTGGYIEIDSWQASTPPAHGGTIHTSESGQLQTTSEGIGGAATGSGFALWAGVIRAPELANNTPQIDHALFIVAPCTSNLTVYPSNWRATSDTTCSGGNGAPYGAYGRLNMTHAQIDALGIPGADLKAIAYAMADYGGYIGDTNGNNGFSVQVEADPTYSQSGSGYTFDGTGCPTNGAPCTPLTAFENHWGNPDWTGDRYSINLSTLLPFSTKWQWLNPPTPR